jgi:hypothetical protein
MFWELYVILNEHLTTIANLWDSTNLKCTSRRCVDHKLMMQWDELITLVLTDNEDEIIWQYTSDGVYYTTRNLYIGSGV